MKKRILALLLTIAMLFSMFPTTALAANSTATFTVTATGVDVYYYYGTSLPTTSSTSVSLTTLIKSDDSTATVKETLTKENFCNSSGSNYIYFFFVSRSADSLVTLASSDGDNGTLPISYLDPTQNTDSSASYRNAKLYEVAKNLGAQTFASYSRVNSSVDCSPSIEVTTAPVTLDVGAKCDQAGQLIGDGSVIDFTITLTPKTDASKAKGELSITTLQIGGKDYDVTSLTENTDGTYTATVKNYTVTNPASNTLSLYVKASITYTNTYTTSQNTEITSTATVTAESTTAITLTDQFSVEAKAGDNPYQVEDINVSESPVFKDGSSNVTWAIADHYHLSSVTVNGDDVTESVTGTGDGYSLSLTNINSNKYVVINAAPDEYKITYDLQDEGGPTATNDSSNPATYTYGEGATIKPATRPGYTFEGWYTDEDCTEGKQKTGIAAGEYGDVTLYAKWTENDVTITYTASPEAGGTVTLNDDGATSAGTSVSEKIGAATGKAFGATAVANTGYYFTGWTLIDATVGSNASYTPRKNTDGVYEEATYIANFSEKTPLTITVTGKSDTTKTYTGKEQSVSGCDITYTINGEEVEQPEGVTVTVKTGADVISGTDAKIYNGTLSENDVAVDAPAMYDVTLVVKPGQLVISPANVTEEQLSLTVTGYEGVYDGASHGVTAKMFGTLENQFELEYSLDGVKWTTVVPTITNVADSNTTKTVYVRAVDTQKNYNTVTAEPVAIVITPATITLKAEAATKVYGDKDPELTYETLEAVVEGETPKAEGDLSRRAGETVDTYTIYQGSVKLVDNDTFKKSNYVISYTENELTITQRPITVTLSAEDKTYDGTTSVNYTLTLDADAIVGEDKVTVTAKTVAFDSEDVQYDEKGLEVIAQGVTATGVTLDNSNYVLVNADGENIDTVTTTAVISPRPLTVKATADSRTYEADNTEVTVKLGDLIAVNGDKGVVDGDVVQILATEVTGTVNSDSVTDENGTKVIYGGSLGLTGEDAGNYTLELPEVKVTITGTLTYDKNTDDVVYYVPTDNNSYRSGEEAFVPTETPQRDNYDFKGWATEAEPTSEESSVELGSYITFKDTSITLYAQWSPSVNTPADPSGDITGKLIDVECANGNLTDGYAHTDTKTYGLMADTYAAGTVTGDDVDGYTCTVTVKIDEYVKAYGTEVNEALNKNLNHVKAAGQADTVQVTLWTDGKADTDGNITWQLAAGAEAPKIQVQCQATVTFDANGGTNTTGSAYNRSSTVPAGTAVTAPSNTEQPIKADCVFDGWYTDKACTNQYDFNQPVYEDTTLYAHWEKDVLNDEKNKTDEGDGIPDKYQVVVTFQVENGYWDATGTDKADKVYVLTLKDEKGNNSTEGTVKLDGIVPTVGSNPDSTHAPGTAANWKDTIPTDTTEVTANETNTYTYVYTYPEKTQLTIVVEDTTVTYNGQTQMGSNAVIEVTGLRAEDEGATVTIESGFTAASGENASDTAYAATFDGTTVKVVNSEDEDVSAYYTVTSISGGNLTINPAILYVTVSFEDKTYDGSKAVDVADATITKGLIEGDKVKVELAATTGEAETKDAGENKAVTYDKDNVTLSGEKSGNYKLNVTIGTVNINKRNVILTSASDEKDYDGTALTNSNVTVSGDGFAGDEYFKADVTGSQTSVGDSENTFTYDLTNGATDQNYDVEPEYGTLKVNTATTTGLTLKADNYNEVYDGQTHSVTPTLTGTAADKYTLLYSVNGGETWTDKVPEIKNVGSVTVSVKAERDGYTDLVFKDAYSLKVTPAEIVVTPTDRSKTYGEADPETLAYTNTKGVNGETPAFTGTLIRADGETVGKYPITQNTLALTDGTDGFLADNYTLTVNEGTFTIDPKNVTLYVTAEGRKYDGTKNITVTYEKLDGVINNDDVTIDGFDKNNTVTGTVETADVENNKAVTYGSELKLNGDKAENYKLVLSAVTVNITQREITLTSATDSKTYDGKPLTNETVTETGDGFVSGEGYTTNVTGTITDAGEADNTFTYALKAGTHAKNYKITTKEGTLTVEQANLYVTVGFKDKTYDGSKAVDVAGTEITKGLIEDDEVTVKLAAATGEAETKDAGANKAVTYDKDNVTLSGKDSDNYKLNVTIGTVNINKRKVTLTSATDSKTYDGKALTNDTVIVSGDDFVTGEGVYLMVTGKQVEADTSKNTFSYTVWPNTSADNYEISPVEGDLTVEKATLDVTVSFKDKTYDGSKAVDVADATITEGLIEGDDVTVSLAAATGEADTKDAGENKAVTYDKDNVTLTGEDSGNYELNVTIGTVNIEKRKITLTSGDNQKTYDGTELTKDEVTVTEGEFVEGEGYEATVTGTRTNAGTSENEFTYTLNEGTSKDNYDITLVKGDLTVEKATLNVTVSFLDKSYDGDATVETETVKITNPKNVYDTLAVVLKAETGEAASANAGANQTVTYSKDDVVLESDASDNYKLNVTIGTVNITKRSVTLTSKNDTKTYDGTELTKHEIIVSGQGFVEGEGIDITYTGTQTEVGSSDNTFTYDMQEGTLADNYAIVTVVGKLTVTGSVTYDANGGTGKMTDEQSPYVKDAEVTVLANEFEKADNTFVGWNTKADGTGTAYAPGDTFKMTENVTLYAQWETDVLNDKDNKTDEGDGIPDKYQTVIEFVSADTEMGTVKGSTTQVFTLTDADGNYATSGTVTPEEVTTVANTGYAFSMYTKDGEEADPYTELSVKGGTTTTFTAQWTELGEITITPVSMVAYVGGSSINGSHMPKLRYAVGTEDIDADLADLSFDIVTVSNGEILSTEHLDRTMINSDDDGLTTYCLFTQLTADMNGESNTVEGSNDTQIQRGNYIKLVDDDNNPDTYAGVYKIELRDGTYSEWDGWYITATDSNGNVYNVNLITVDENSDPYTVTIREVSAETNGTDTVEIYDNIGDYTAPVATEYKEDSTGFAAVVDETTTFATNGQDDLGVLVYDTDEDGNAKKDTINTDNTTNADVALLVDDTVSLNPKISEQDLQDMMLEYASAEVDSFDGSDIWNTEFKYLDLVNTSDGNAVVTASKDVTVYWPYPTGIDASNAADYEFQILHFKGMDREDVVTDAASLANIATVEVISGDALELTDNGLCFSISSFSPFVLVWAKKCTLTVEHLCSSTSCDNTGKPDAITIDTYVGATVSIADIEDQLGTWADHLYDNTLYYDPAMKDYIERDVTEITVADNMTIYAGYLHQGGDVGEVTYYTLTYVLNNGSENQEESYEAGTTVTLVKQPIREGYTFTGWYTDEKLTEKAETITMNENTTVYAGWEASTVPDMLNGDDHFAYIVGYEDGTVRPDGNITRAEVATIFFRLLKEDIRNEYLTSENPFADVSENAWYCKAVSTLTALGIIQGRNDTSFAPNEPITRAELAAICARFDTGVTSGKNTFSDISGHWAETDIQRAAALGWITGYEDETFRPNDNITRAEAITLINRVLCRIPEDESDLLPDMNIWPDNADTGAWYYLAIQEATNSHDFRHKGEIYETWTEMQEDPDWEQYEK